MLLGRLGFLDQAAGAALLLVSFALSLLCVSCLPLVGLEAKLAKPDINSQK